MTKSPGLPYLSREDVSAVGPAMAEIIAALEEMATAVLVHRRALQRGAGISLPL